MTTISRLSTRAVACAGPSSSASVQDSPSNTASWSSSAPFRRECVWGGRDHARKISDESFGVRHDEEFDIALLQHLQAAGLLSRSGFKVPVFRSCQ